MEDLYISPQLTIPSAELTVSMARSSGPGGQNVNKVNSKVMLRWAIWSSQNIDGAWRQRFLSANANRINRRGEVVLHSDRYRDQIRNLADARQKLTDLLLDCRNPPKRRKPTKPSRASQRRRLDQKKQRSQKKQARNSDWRSD